MEDAIKKRLESLLNQEEESRYFLMQEILLTTTDQIMQVGF